MVYGRLKRRFRVASYQEILATQFEDVLQFLHDLSVPALTEQGKLF